MPLRELILKQKSVFLPVVVALLLFPALLSHAQKNTWKFEENASVNIPFNSVNGIKSGPGIGFVVGLSYCFVDHWQVHFAGRWNSFPSAGPVADSHFASYAIGALSLGGRYERALMKSVRWYAGTGGLVAKCELYDDAGKQSQSNTPVYGWNTEAGVSAMPLEGLEVGVFVTLTNYFDKPRLTPVPAAGHAGAGISLRWWWW